MIPAPAPAPVHDRTSVDDWRALGDLVSLATDRLSTMAEGVHHAIADRGFGIAGRNDSAVRSAYRSFTDRIYGSVRLAGSVARTGLGVGAAAWSDHTPVRPVWRSPVGSGVQAAANALWGDEFARRSSLMHTELGIRDPDGALVTPDSITLRRTFPEATGRLVVLLHGLGHTEHCWQAPADESGEHSSIPSALEADSFTPVFVRYNTGMHVSENGASLAQLLEETVTNWPVAVDEIALVGHSMGGLIARSSLHIGEEERHTWISSARHLVALAAPHHGSPIEKGAHLASRALNTAAEGRPIGKFIDERSDGIKDMRFGTIHMEGWLASGVGAATSNLDVPLVEGVDHHLVAGVITEDVAHPVGRLLGDLVVRVGSATGIGPRGQVEATNSRVFGGLNHPGLLQHAAVHSQVRDWLTSHTMTTPGEPA